MNCDYSEEFYKKRYYFFKLIPSCFYKYILKYYYKKILNKTLSFKNPTRLTEKIQCLKLNAYKGGIDLADKIWVKEYVKKLIPEINVAQIYCIANSFEELDFDLCPKSFIIKLNHSWKTNTVIKDKALITKEDYEKYSKYYKTAISIDYEYWAFFEFEYKNIPHKIFTEEYLGEPDFEYEVYCFNGVVQFVRINLPLIDEMGCLYYESYIYSKDKTLLEFSLFYTPLEYHQINLDNFATVVKYAETLSKDLQFVRMDFMEINNKLYFGEFTLTPHSGFIKFIPEKFDEIYGKKLKLS